MWNFRLTMKLRSNFVVSIPTKLWLSKWYVCGSCCPPQQKHSFLSLLTPFFLWLLGRDLRGLICSAAGTPLKLFACFSADSIVCDISIALFHVSSDMPTVVGHVMPLQGMSWICTTPSISLGRRSSQLRFHLPSGLSCESENVQLSWAVWGRNDSLVSLQVLRICTPMARFVGVSKSLNKLSFYPYRCQQYGDYFLWIFHVIRQYILFESFHVRIPVFCGWVVGIHTSYCLFVSMIPRRQLSCLYRQNLVALL